MNNGDFLYHYTNIETLALILKNRTFRFNSLDKMDDLQEQETSDIKNVGQFCYISSWTDDEAESIPMWNMYASLNLGVRIKLRKNPFKVYYNDAEEFSKSFNMQVDTDGSSFKSLIPLSEMFSKGFISMQLMYTKQILFMVEYTSDKKKLYPNLLKKEGDQFSILMQKLGKHKNIHWDFQKEWRYIFYTLPLDSSKLLIESLSDLPKTANEMRLGLAKQPFSYYDMTIDDIVFAEMEITLSPRISAGSKVIVENLVEKYNPSAKINNSSLLGMI